MTKKSDTKLSGDQLTLFAAVTPARPIQTPGDMERFQKLRQVISCESLRKFIPVMFSGRIRRQSEKMRPGPGGDLRDTSKEWAIWFCPSKSGRVVLVGITEGNACTCSPRYRRPTARDWKGMSAKSWRERTKGDKTPTLPDQLGGGFPTPNLWKASWDTKPDGPT